MDTPYINDDGLMKYVSEKLHEKKMRLTQPRQRVLEAFFKSGQLQTAQELYNYALGQGINIGLTTVYRLLEALSDLGFARAFFWKGEVRYTFCSPRHHYHLICNGCGRIKEMFDCPVINMDTGEFKANHHQLDVFGLCQQCQKITNNTEQHS